MGYLKNYVRINKVVALVAAIMVLPFHANTIVNSNDNIGHESAYITWVSGVYNDCQLYKFNLSLRAFEAGLTGLYNLKDAGKISDDRYLTIVDYSKSAREKRFYTIDLKDRRLKYWCHVSHGMYSGSEYATRFSNRMNSFQTSLGFFITQDTYSGKRGYSLRLDGVDYGFNHNARKRGVVMHTAPNAKGVDVDGGKLGRTLGCFGLPSNIYKRIIADVKDGSCVFAYYPDDTFLSASKWNNEVCGEDFLTSLK